MVAGLLVTLHGPVLYACSGKATDLANNRMVRQRISVLVIGCISLTMVASVITLILRYHLIDLLVAPAYRNIGDYLPWLIIGGGLFAAGQIFALQLMADLRSRELLAVKIATAVFGTAFHFLGAWRFGIPGIVLSVILHSSIFFLWTHRLALRSNPPHKSTILLVGSE
jgi:O-antigen/teichoic acid export membrane protein